MAGFNPADYETVDSRIHRFYDTYPEGRILTQIVEIYRDDNGRPIQYILRAEAFRDREATIPDATGYAEETVSVSTAPKSSLLETCETSAIGRCLANLSFSAKGSRPSRTEMEKAARHEEPSRSVKKAAPRIAPTADYREAAVLKLRANALDADGKQLLLERWPEKLVRPIPDHLPPSVYTALEAVLDGIENGETAPSAAPPVHDCATCGGAERCPLPAAAQAVDPQCLYYQGDDQ